MGASGPLRRTSSQEEFLPYHTLPKTVEYTVAEAWRRWRARGGCMRATLSPPPDEPAPHAGYTRHRRVTCRTRHILHSWL
eukprot:6205225-Pleurochrysis_carterae.AAC.3